MGVNYVTNVSSGGTAALAVGTTGGAVVGMPNHGISLIEGTSTEIFVIAPPVYGVQKRLICSAATTTVTPTVRFSTTAGQGIASAGGVPATILKFAATRSTVCATVVDLVGLSSVQWAIVNVFPCMSTGAGNGAITLSTT